MQNAELLARNASKQLLNALLCRQRHHGGHDALVSIGDRRKVVDLSLISFVVIQVQVSQRIEVIINREHVDIAHKLLVLSKTYR